MLSVSLQTTDTELERKNELFLLHMYDAIYATLKAFFFNSNSLSSAGGEPAGRC